MNFRSSRKVTPKVINGHIQKKNRHEETPNIWTSDEFLLEKERPGKGYRHIITRSDLIRFFEIIPNWEIYSQDLNGVRLSAGGCGFAGLYYHAGLICIPAWNRDIWRIANDSFFQEHRGLYDRLKVPYEADKDCWLLKFTEETARAYQLLHIFFHELGHHRDKMTTRNKHTPSRGEDFAEQWAYNLQRKVWDRYQETFGHF